MACSFINIFRESQNMRQIKLFDLLAFSVLGLRAISQTRYR